MAVTVESIAVVDEETTAEIVYNLTSLVAAQFDTPQESVTVTET